MREFYIWKDPVDDDTYHIGVKMVNGRLYIAATMFTDAVHDLFGRDFHDLARKTNYLEPMHIKFDIYKE